LIDLIKLNWGAIVCSPVLSKSRHGNSKGES
jgi:hypothetical protein